MRRKIEDLRFFQLAVLFAALFLLSGFALATYMIGWATTSPGSLRGEALKLLLQFLLITGLGGVIAAILTHVRDEQGRREQAERTEHENQRKEQREWEAEKRKQDREIEADLRQKEREREALRREQERDQQLRQERRITALQEIEGDLSRSYRRFKFLKRKLRAQCMECDRKDGQISPPYRFDRREFAALGSNGRTIAHALKGRPR